MKGKLIKTEEGWMVGTVCYADIWSELLPLYEETFDPNTKQLIIPLEDGKQVEFEMVNYDGNTKMSEGWIGYAKIITAREQTNGERFEEFMRTVEGYPELEGTMNLCEDIIEKKTGKMTEEEWQAAENNPKPKYTPGKGISFYIENEISDEEIEKAANEYAWNYQCPSEVKMCKHDIISAWNNAIKWYKEQFKKK